MCFRGHGDQGDGCVEVQGCLGCGEGEGGGEEGDLGGLVEEVEGGSGRDLLTAQRERPGHFVDLAARREVVREWSLAEGWCSRFESMVVVCHVVMEGEEGDEDEVGRVLGAGKFSSCALVARVLAT